MQTSSVNPLGVYDSSTALWLQGKGQQAQTEPQKQDTHTEKSAALLTGRTEEFNRRLREQPADTQLWIQFIRYQVRRLHCIGSCKHLNLLDSLFKEKLRNALERLLSLSF